MCNFLNFSRWPMPSIFLSKLQSFTTTVSLTHILITVASWDIHVHVFWVDSRQTVITYSVTSGISRHFLWCYTHNRHLGWCLMTDSVYDSIFRKICCLETYSSRLDANCSADCGLFVLWDIFHCCIYKYYPLVCRETFMLIYHKVYNLSRHSLCDICLCWWR